MLMATVSWLDVILVVMLVGSIAFGFHQGLLRQVFLLVAMYAGVLLSAQYYQYPLLIVRAIFPTSGIEMARLVAFILLMVGFTVAVTWLIWAAYRGTRLPDALVLDGLGGSALGGIVGIFAINLTLMLIRYALDAPWPEGSALRYYLHTGLYESALQAVLRSPLPLIDATIRPWLPPEIPLVLSS